MDVGKIASLYIHGSEQAVRGNEMFLTAVLRRRCSIEGVQRAYRRFVEENPAIASKLVEDPARGRFEWQPFTREERDSRLWLEHHELAFEHDAADVYDAYYPTNDRLPFRIVRVGPETLVFCVNHAFSNGKGLIAWVSRWFSTYAEEIGEPLPTHGPVAIGAAPGAVRSFFAAVVGVFWTLAYLIGFVARAGKKPAENTVDLGKPGEPLCCEGFVVERWVLPAAEVNATAKARGLTVGQHLGAALAQSFFDEQPARDRVCFSMPLDLRGELPHVPLEAIGNYTGSLVVQVHRGGDAASQIRRAYRWLVRRVPYWLTWLVGGTTESKLFQRFSAQAERPNTARAPLENFTFALSNLGRIDDPILEHFVARLSGHTRTQTIFVAAMTLGDELVLEASFARDLYPADAVVRVLDGLSARVLARGACGSERNTPSSWLGTMTGREDSAAHARIAP